MSDQFGELTVADLEAMGIRLEDLEAMLMQQGGMGGQGYGQYGILDPIDISSQATQWDILDAQKSARAATAPPSPHERGLTRNFMFPNPDQFGYDAVAQSNPYIRELLNEAITLAGPDDPFAARSYVTGRIAEGEPGRPEEDVGKTRIGKEVTEALPDFREIASAFKQDDERWATRDPREQRALLQEWLSDEAENWFAGAAPSAARNVNWSDWAQGHQSGEQFPGYEGAGFDQPLPQPGEPRVQTDPERWGPTPAQGQAAEMSATDFRRVYQDSLLKNVAGLQAGQRIEDPEMGGHWEITNNPRPLSALERARARDRRIRPQQSDRKTTGGRNIIERGGDANRSYWNRVLGSLLRFGR